MTGGNKDRGDASANAETLASEGALPLGRGARVLSERSEGLVILEKPAGVLSHPNRSADQGKCLLNAAYDFESESYGWTERGRSRHLYLAHRLDAPTSGVIVAALNPDLARCVQNLFRDRLAKKTYVALTLGAPRGGGGVWRDRWREGADRNGRGGAGPALSVESHCEVLGDDRRGLGLMELRLTPKTGRTHQLRLQCARRNAPILGDCGYGNFRRNRELAKRVGSRRMFLHAARIALDFVFEGRRIQVSVRSEIPSEFEVALGRPCGEGKGSQN